MRVGRPPFVPTDSQRQIVQVLVANGIAHRVIAANVHCDLKTLKRYFSDELRAGHDQVEAAMGAAIVRAGLAGNIHAAKYWLLTHGGPEWRITERREITGSLEPDLRNVPTADLEAELAALRRRKAIADRARELNDAPPDSIH